MRRFNPEKELKKIQKGNKNKIIISIIALLIIIAIGSSYALYQIRYNKQIIYTTVAPFYSKDMQLAVYVDGVRQEEFPDKSPDMLYGGYECEKDSKITFNKDDWSITLKTNKPDKCNIRFGTKYEDKSGANYPELYQGMIPVYFKEGKIYIADVTSEWYNYDNNEWANAVLIDYQNNKDKFYDDNNNLLGGHEVSENDILQMYVWIPRYKYEIFNVGLEGTPKQLINIEFEKGTDTTGNIKCTYTNNGDGTITEDCKDKTTQDPVKNTDWYTHPAFTFKGTTEESGTELPGIWVGKFEPSDAEDELGKNVNNIGEITILPGKTSMTNKNASTMFNAERDIKLKNATKYNLNSEQIDTRIMKNIEWGAMAYLTQSIYGIYKDENTCNVAILYNECEIGMNKSMQSTENSVGNYYGAYTGCVGYGSKEWNTEEGKPAQCSIENRWNIGGVNASTTGNMYGIYDVAGGAWDIVMGIILRQGSANINLGNSGFTTTEGPNKVPDSKYYDIYTFDAAHTMNDRGHLGDATTEVKDNLNANNGGWNHDAMDFPAGNASFFSRGGLQDTGWLAGVLTAGINGGGVGADYTYRSVLSAA